MARRAVARVAVSTHDIAHTPAFMPRHECLGKITVLPLHPLVFVFDTSARELMISNSPVIVEPLLPAKRANKRDFRSEDRQISVLFPSLRHIALCSLCQYLKGRWLGLCRQQILANHVVLISKPISQRGGDERLSRVTVATLCP